MPENFGVNQETVSADGLLGGSHETIRIPVTIVTGSGVLKRGTVLGRITASGKYKPYASGSSDGSEVARAILARDCDATSADAAITAFVHGEFRESALTGIDAASKLKLQEFGIFIKK